MAEKNMIWIIALVVIGVVLFNSGFFSNLGGGNNNNNPTQPIVTSATTTTIAPVDAITGAAISGTYQLGVNGGQLGSATSTASTASLSQGNTLALLINSTGYHSIYLTGLTVPASTTYFINSAANAKLYKNATLTMSVFNTNSVVMTNGGGATNQTDNGAGSAYNFDLRLLGQDQASTNDMDCLVDVQTGANVSKVTWDGQTGVKTSPAWYTMIGATSNVYAFTVPAITNAVTKDSFVLVQAASGKVLKNNKVVITCATKENFLDSNNGQVSYASVDSLGTQKSAATYSTSFYFT